MTTDTKPGRYAAAILVVAACYGLLFLRLHAQWWFEDDPYLFAFAGRYARPWVFFWSRQALSRDLIGLLFTPLQSVSYWIDDQLAPRSPEFAYAHTLASLSIGALMLFAVLRHWLGSIRAFTLVILYLFLPSTVVVVEFLSTRNYLDGFALSLIAIWLAQRACSQDKAWRMVVFSAVAAVFYLLGGLAKELYVTTPFVLILAMYAYHRRWLAAAWLIAAGAGYVIYYRAIVGSLASTFHVPTLTTSGYLRFLGHYPYVFGGSAAGWWLAAFVTAAIAYGVARRAIPGRVLALGLVLVVVSMATMYPAAAAVDGTYLSRGTWYRATFVSNVTILVVFAWLLTHMSRGWRAAASASAVFTLVLGAWLTAQTWDGLHARYQVEGQFYLDHPNALVYSEVPAWWFLVGIDDLYHVPTSHYVLAAHAGSSDAAVLARYPTIWRYLPGAHIFTSDDQLYRSLRGRP